MKKLFIPLIISIFSIVQAQNVLMYQNNMPLVSQEEFDPLFERLSPYLNLVHNSPELKEQLVLAAAESLGWIKLIKLYVAENSIECTPTSKWLGETIGREMKKIKLCFLSSAQIQDMTTAVVSILQGLHGKHFIASYLTDSDQSKLQNMYEQLRIYSAEQNIPPFKEIEWFLQLTVVVHEYVTIQQLIKNDLIQIHDKLEKKYQTILNKDLIKENYL